MAATGITTEAEVLSATTDASGNAVFDIDVSAFSNAAQQVMRFRGEVYAGTASGGLMVGAGAATCEGVYQYLGSPATLAALTAQSGSVNPLNSNSTGEENAWPQAANSTFGTGLTATLTTSGTNIVVTVHATGAAGGPVTGATVFLYFTLRRWGIT